MARYDDLSEYDWLMAEIIKHESDQARVLGHILMDKLSPKSVIDVGCGPGIYLLPFLERGAEVMGIDGAPRSGQSLPATEPFQIVDLRNPWFPPRRFDLALCIEVAEHLRPQYAGILVDTVCRCADVVFWTAARPDQGGEGHYNQQTKDYWLDLFAGHGYGLSPRNEQVMAEVNRLPEFEHCKWVRWNGMLIERSK